MENGYMVRNKTSTGDVMLSLCGQSFYHCSVTKTSTLSLAFYQNMSLK